MNPFFQIDIPKRNSSCCKGGEQLHPGMEYYSLLIEEENQKFMRRDFCMSCWDQIMTTDEFNKSHSYWKSRIEPKIQLTLTLQPKLERALNLLKSLLTQPDPNESEIFILSLFLARARQLVLRREFEEQSHTYFLYEISHQEEFIKIKSMKLSSEETNKVQQILSQKLK